MSHRSIAPGRRTQPRLRVWPVLLLGFTLGLWVLRASTADPSASSIPSAGQPAAAAEVGPISLTVSDLDRSIEFYSGVLCFTLEGRAEHAGDAYERSVGLFGARAISARLRLGSEAIELTQFLTPEGRPIPVGSRSNDRWFQHLAIVVSDIDQAYARLRAHGVAHASSGPQVLPDWNPQAGGIAAFYFKDPDGHVLELIRFPPGKGDPRWHQAGGNLFQGIDHTAIVVGDTDRSLAFYRDALGLRVAGASENYGTEQEHLNNVFGARLRITALRAPRGPGIELLEYLAPSDGREFPADARTSDLVHWQVTLSVPSAESAAVSARNASGRWVSAGAVPDPEMNRLRSALVRDPDGHALLLRERADTSVGPIGEVP